MDIFHEQIVKKQLRGLRLLAMIAIIIGFVLALAATFIFLSFIGLMAFLIMAGLAYLGWYIVTGFNIEYEYILTNDELDIDKIIAKRKRKRLISIKMPAVTEFAKLTEKNADAGNRTLVDCAGNELPAFAMDFKHERMGDCRLLFTPTDEMKDQMVKVLPRQLRIKYKDSNII
ncbi:MAG: hypothetical protein LBM59_05650 [Ruminococcus sp.]|jgi:hypothetical protein|nr:hypothetical protein [Ruminococcus sp.]